MKVHRQDRAPILIDRRTGCWRAFNASTGTALQGTQRRPVELVLILRGIAQGSRPPGWLEDEGWASSPIPSAPGPARTQLTRPLKVR